MIMCKTIHIQPIFENQHKHSLKEKKDCIASCCDSFVFKSWQVRIMSYTVTHRPPLLFHFLVSFSSFFCFFWFLLSIHLSFLFIVRPYKSPIEFEFAPKALYREKETLSNKNDDIFKVQIQNLWLKIFSLTFWFYFPPTSLWYCVYIYLKSVYTHELHFCVIYLIRCTRMSCFKTFYWNTIKQELFVSWTPSIFWLFRIHPSYTFTLSYFLFFFFFFFKKKKKKESWEFWRLFRWFYIFF